MLIITAELTVAFRRGGNGHEGRIQTRVRPEETGGGERERERRRAGRNNVQEAETRSQLIRVFIFTSSALQPGNSASLLVNSPF